MKNLIRLILITIILVTTNLAQQKKSINLDDYKVSVYKGKLHLPKWIKFVGENEWRDELNKLVTPPIVNFAGKYYLAVHSCGTGCRYYSLTDLSSGRELEVLNMFNTLEEHPKTRNGYEYTTILYSVADNKTLRAHYVIDIKDDKSKCRERQFLFEKKKLKAITNTKDVPCEY